MNDESKETLIVYVRAIVSVLDAFEVLYPRGRRLEKLFIRILRMTYRGRLKYFTNNLPPEILDQIMGNRESPAETSTE